MMLRKTVCLVVFVVLLGMTGVAQAGLVDLVPQDVPLVFSVNITKILKVPSIRKIFDDALAAGGKEGGMDDFVTRTGIDIKRDIHNMLVFLGAGKDPMTGQAMAGVLFNGSFSTAKIIKLIQTDRDLVKNAELENIQGYNGLTSSTNPNGNGVFLDDNTIALGSMGVLRGITAVVSGKEQSLPKHPAFAALLKKVNTALGVWAGLIVTPQWKAEANKNPVTAPLASLKAAIFGLDIDKEFYVHFSGEVEKVAQLKGFMDALENYVDAVQAWAVGAPEVVEMLKLARVEGNGATARVSIKMSKDRFDKLMTSLGARLGK